ncbi:MAG: (deoxy)nucleoside triphosphate pyrophosphohydrolase [Calditrichaeota bacterium]|nr:(deoxy)nucleoside triphosphate pyrophosphohydrolase [Calditrichota bacterium]
MKKSATDTSAKPVLVVTAGLIFRGEKFLITQRPVGDPFAGKWEFPGGKRRDGETLENCLAREIREELNIKIDVQKHLTTVNHEYQNFFIQLHVFRCLHISGTPQPDQNQKWEWISADKLRDFDFLEADRVVIEKLNKSGDSNFKLF